MLVTWTVCVFHWLTSGTSESEEAQKSKVSKDSAVSVPSHQSRLDAHIKRTRSITVNYSSSCVDGV
jgi:hypothetical protein